MTGRSSKRPFAASPRPASRKLLGFAGAALLALSGAQAWAAPDPNSYIYSTAQAVSLFEERARQSPEDFANLTMLAQLYIREAREGGGMESYGKAERTLREALRLYSGHLPAKALLAAVLTAQHQFVDGLELAEQVLESGEKDTRLMALATMGDAYIELGRYEDAEEAYAKLAKESTASPVLARRAHLAELRGKPAEALKLLRQAAKLEQGDVLVPANAAWYHVQAGDLLFRMGKLDEARKEYDSALARLDNHEPALRGLGAVYAAKGQDARAISYYQRALPLAAEPANVHGPLGDLYLRAGQPELARCHHRKVAHLLEHLHAHSHSHDHGVATHSHDAGAEHVHGRVLSIFLSDHGIHLPQALELARQELEVRRDIYTLDALAWALYKNGEFAEADAVMKDVLRLGTRDPLLLYHAGMISAGAGERSAALGYLKSALKINPGFSPLGAEEARRTVESLSGKLAGVKVSPGSRS